MRGLAIALVFWYHAPFLFLDVKALPSFGFWSMSTAGWIGVDLFFVVSGFLITTILLRTRGQVGQLPTFWARRALRILPLAYLYLLVLALQPAIGNPLGVLERFDGWPWYFMHFANVYIAQHGFQPLAVMMLWSLAVEEQFYVVWPFVVRRFRPRALMKVCIAIAIVGPVMRLITLRYPATYVLTLCRADTLAAGAVLALLLADPHLRDVTLQRCRQLTGPALIVLAITLVAPFGPSFSSTHPLTFSVAGYSLIAASFAVLVGASLTATGLARAVLCHPILCYVGKRCYGFYIWHCFVGVAVAHLSAKYFPGVLGFGGLVALWLLCTTVVASASWFLFEKPILALKRFVPHQGQRPEPAPASASTLSKTAPNRTEDDVRNPAQAHTARRAETTRV